MGYLCRGHCWVTVRSAARFAGRHLWGICAAVSVGLQCVVARFARRHLMVFVRPLVLGHSTCWLASLVGTYGVFVLRTVLGHSA